MSISDDMRRVFLESWKIYEMEREFNYQNWGKYPYRDRKNSVQIVADFNANAYSINGLFVAESMYTQVYPPQIIESIEMVLIGVRTRYIENVTKRVFIDGVLKFIEYGDPIQQEYEVYAPVVTREIVEVEAVEVQTMSYLFPFSCVPDSMGRLRLSL